MPNRRKHKRVTIKSIAEFCRTDGGVVFKAFVGGVSLGGLEFYAEQLVKSDTELEITIYFMDSDGKEVLEGLRGVVRWSAAFRGSYIAGVQFSEIVEKEKNPKLFEYIKKAEEYLN